MLVEALWDAEVLADSDALVEALWDAEVLADSDALVEAEVLVILRRSLKHSVKQRCLRMQRDALRYRHTNRIRDNNTININAIKRVDRRFSLTCNDRV